MGHTFSYLPVVTHVPRRCQQEGWQEEEKTEAPHSGEETGVEEILALDERREEEIKAEALER